MHPRVPDNRLSTVFLRSGDKVHIYERFVDSAAAIAKARHANIKFN